MNSSVQVELSLQVLKQFRLVYGSAKRQFRHIEQSCGISGSQLWLLQEIEKTPGIGVSELAKRLSIHLSTCSLLVEKLKSKKLLLKIRDEADQRRVGLKATEAGIAALANAPGPAEGVLPMALQELPESELKKLHASMEKLIAKLHMVDESAADKPLSDI
jgi:DNA-binding MarR family transcriptional regulator